MARTAGAIDKRPRKKSTGSRPKTKPAAQIAAGLPAGDPPAAGPSKEFLQQIEAAMGGPDNEHTLAEPGSQAPNGVTAVCDPAPVSPAQEELLTKEAFEGVLRVPFRLIATITSSPGVADVGKRRAKDLARPAWPIFQHYAKEYLAMNPDDPLSLCWAATALVATDIAEEVYVAILQARADRRARELPASVPGGGAVQSQAA